MTVEEGYMTISVMNLSAEGFCRGLLQSAVLVRTRLLEWASGMDFLFIILLIQNVGHF
jgi:hypothetical protein